MTKRPESVSWTLQSDKTKMKLENGEIIDVTLYDSDTKCEHEIDPWNYDGIRCRKCSGWFIL